MPDPVPHQPLTKPVQAQGLLRQRITYCIAGRWLALHDIRHELIIRYDDYSSEATISSEIRRLRREEYGAWPIVKRIVPGKHYYEYRLDV